MHSTNEQIKIIGERIRVIRNDNKLSQAELSKKCGVAKNYISLVENGNANVSIGKLASICEALCVSLGDVLPPTTPLPLIDPISIHKILLLSEEDRRLILEIIDRILC